MLSEFLTQDILGQFTDPKKRLFFGYVISAFFIAFLWLLFIKKNSVAQSVRNIFTPDIWLSKSSRIDGFCFIINRVFFFFLQPVLITQIAIATMLYHWLHGQTFLQVNLFETAPYLLAASAFTLVYFLFDDFARFVTHMALHKIPALWEFHKFHHSAEHLTPLTVTRTHPIEGPVTTTEFAPTASSWAPNDVPKKPLACCFSMTDSSAAGSSLGSISTQREPGVRLFRAGNRCRNTCACSSSL